MIWFTSDLHLYHTNVIEMENRPFNTVEEMNNAIYTTLERIPAEDTLYILGDVFWKFNDNILHEFIYMTNCNIKIIRGNHDKRKWLQRLLVCPRIKILNDIDEVKYQGERFILSHFPIMSWNAMHHGSYHLHGHCHGNLTFNLGKAMDVGIDTRTRFEEWGQLYSIDEVINTLKNKRKVSYDHH